MSLTPSLTYLAIKNLGTLKYCRFGLDLFSCLKSTIAVNAIARLPGSWQFVATDAISDVAPTGDLLMLSNRRSFPIMALAPYQG